MKKIKKATKGVNVIRKIELVVAIFFPAGNI